MLCDVVMNDMVMYDMKLCSVGIVIVGSNEWCVNYWWIWFLIKLYDVSG